MNISMTDFFEDEEGNITAKLHLDAEANEHLINKAFSTIIQEASIEPQPNTVELFEDQVEPLIINYLKNMYLNLAPITDHEEDVTEYEGRRTACEVILKYIMSPSEISKFFGGIKYGNP